MAGILIVDDQESVLIELAAKVRDSGVELGEIMLAGSAEEAREIINRKAPDICMLDIHMPGESGLDLLQSLRSKNHELPRVIMVSSYDDFTFAQKAIENGVDGYLLKPVSMQELTRTLLRSKRRLLDSQPSVSASADELAQRELQEVASELLSVLSGEVDAGLADVDMLTEKLGITKPIAALGIIHGKNLELHDDTVFIRSKHTSSDTQEVIALFTDASKIAQYKEISEHGECRFAYSESRSDSNLRELYREARTALRECIYNNRAYCSWLDIRDSVRDLITNEECSKLMTLIRSSNESTVYGELSQMFSKIGNDSGKYEIEYNFEKLLWYLSIEFSKEMKRISPKICDASSRIAFMRSLTFNELCFMVTETIEQIMKSVKSSNPTDEDYVSNYIKRHIMLNFEKDISLTVLANELDMNYSYCSSLFKQKTGMTFSQYLIQVRMEAAARMLLSDDSNDIQRINQIALSCGYSDSKYFCREFKKYFNQTPKDYRKKRIGGIR